MSTPPLPQDVLDAPTTGLVNRGWPCYEGATGASLPNAAWDALEQPEDGVITPQYLTACVRDLLAGEDALVLTEAVTNFQVVAEHLRLRLAVGLGLVEREVGLGHQRVEGILPVGGGDDDGDQRGLRVHPRRDPGPPRGPRRRGPGSGAPSG